MYDYARLDCSDFLDKPITRIDTDRFLQQNNSNLRLTWRNAIKIKSISLKDFKRFTSLKIEGLPESTRLVVLVGPNGSGKSSLFEAFNVFSYRARGNNVTEKDYWAKITDDSLFASSVNVWNLYNNQVIVDFHDFQALASGTPTDADKKSFYIRSCYRHEGDFSISSIGKVGDLLDDPKRPAYLISQDSRVSDNYQRLIATTLAEVFDRTLDDRTPRKEIRERLIGEVAEALKRVLPDLKLTGPGDPMQDGTFLFEKGAAQNWKYKNLSGGEKAAFDLLLDFVVKVQRFDNTVFCIDEPEVHMHTSVQASLLKEMIRQLPSNSQLWIATHSVGMMRAARDLKAQRSNEVVFLDFGGSNFDEAVIMKPSIPNRAFWKRNFEVALGDLAHLVAPGHIVFCEGSTQESGNGFDAQCYETIFGGEFPDVEFVSTGGTSDLQKNALAVSAVMERIISGVKFTTIRDRDDATENEIREWRAQGLHVLSRRTIESYLWDDEVLRQLCLRLDQSDKVTDVIAFKQREMESVRQRGFPIDDVKAAAGNIYAGLRRILDTRGLGSTRRAFSRDTLATLITPDTNVYQELKQDIFRSNAK